MRLIDVNALKELEPHYSEDGYRVFYEYEIDNAPTVEPQMPREYRQALEALEYIKERYILVEKSPREDPNALLVAGQQKGEWTDLSTDGRHTGWFACSVCGQEPPNESNFRTDFCPNCGAVMDMRGGAK